MLEKLKASSRQTGENYSDEFDLLIVGGGATGAGVAVDAASRGLKVALVERDDFSSGKLFYPQKGAYHAFAVRVHLRYRGHRPMTIIASSSPEPG